VAVTERPGPVGLRLAMGLSDDQRAMLRMVAQRGEQGYEDIAALMGLSVEEVRTRVAAALAELDSEGALAAEAKDAAAEPPAPAQEPPAAQEPEAPPAQPPRAPSGPPKVRLPTGAGLRAAIGAAIVVIALIVVIVIVSGGGDEEPGSATAAAGTTTASEKTSGGGEGKGESGSEANQLTKAQLTAVDGSEAEGVAIFGRVKKSLALEIAAEGLQKTGKGEAYTIWLSKNKRKMLPLASTKAPNGRIAAKFEIPVDVLAYLADETFTDLALTRTDESQLNAALKTATKAKTTPDYTGTEVLRGEITGPIVGAQFKLEELEELEKEAEEAGKGE
jgi:hypothetical protein